MTFLSLVRSRRSVRSFDGNALSESELSELLDFARAAENPYGLTLTWCLFDAEKTGLSSPVITGEKAYLAAKTARAPHAEEALGFSFERAAELEEGEIMPIVSPLGRAAKKMSLREIMMRKGISADSRFPFEKLFFNGSFDAPLKAEEADPLAGALEAVRWAPSACNYQPWRLVVCGDSVHFYLKRNRGFAADRAFDTQKIDMGIALCHFALAAERCGIPVTFRTEDPGLSSGDDVFYIATYELG